MRVHPGRGERGDQRLPDARQRRGLAGLDPLGAIERGGLDRHGELAGDRLEEVDLAPMQTSFPLAEVFDGCLTRAETLVVERPDHWGNASAPRSPASASTP